MIRVEISPLIILVNNSGYVIKEEIHTGPYNTISDWSQPPKTKHRFIKNSAYVNGEEISRHYFQWPLVLYCRLYQQ